MLPNDRKIIGYTSGVFDLFHIGHLNILRNAKSMCDHLIVGVTTDELVEQRKQKRPIIPFSERVEIVQAISFVGTAVAEDSFDKMLAWKRYRFDVTFKGSDWQGTDLWIQLEKDFAAVGVRVVYFPYTQDTSSTIIRETLRMIRDDNDYSTEADDAPAEGNVGNDEQTFELLTKKNVA
jgi:glycerol-3-phosphate cytidylyltransferase